MLLQRRPGIEEVKSKDQVAMKHCIAGTAATVRLKLAIASSGRPQAVNDAQDRACCLPREHPNPARALARQGSGIATHSFWMPHELMCNRVESRRDAVAWAMRQRSVFPSPLITGRADFRHPTLRLA